MAEAFAFTASILILVVMGIYLYKVVYSTTRPNTATWLIWVIVMSLNTGTYYEVVKGDLKEMALPSLATSGVILIFIYSLFKGKFQRIEVFDVATVGLSFAIGVVWKTTGDAILANLALQMILLMSFFPTVRSVWKDPRSDHWLPWAIAVASYSFQILAVLWSLDGWTWPELAFPFANGILGNGSVPVAMWLKKHEGNLPKTRKEFVALVHSYKS